MLVINKLTRAGGIRFVVLRSSSVVVRTITGEEIVYRRDGDESVQEVQVRRSSLPAGIQR